MGQTRRSSLIRWTEARQVARLFGDLARLAPGTSGFHEHFLARSADLLNSRVTVLMETTPLHRGPLRLDVLGSWGWLDERQTARFRHDASQHLYRANLFLQALTADLSGSRAEKAVTRRQLVGDPRWYRSPYVNETFRELDLDDVVLGAVPLEADGRWLWLAFLRAWGDRASFLAHDRKLALLLSTGLSRAVRTRPPRWTCPGEGLPRRLQEVHMLLLDGLSEKQIARRLDLSPGTVHRHVSRLYAELGVNSRSELFALALAATRTRASHAPPGTE